VPSKLDVYQNPVKQPAPVLLYFHGGAWTTGERPKSAASFRSFLEMGFSVLSVSYRLSDVAPAPAAVQDARCALAWVKANAGKYGFDTSGIVTHGTSAGGQLALMAAMLPVSSDMDLPGCRDVPRVAAVLDYYGPADVAAFAGKSPRTQKWLGAGPTGTEMGRVMSPLAHVRAGLPPILIVHGDADPTVPYEQSERLRDALSAAGVPNRLHTVPGGEHGNFSEEQKQSILREVTLFLTRHKIITDRAGGH
jgi:acetyl esterase/lipase